MHHIPIRKIIISIAVILVVFVSAKIIMFELFKSCGNCRGPVELRLTESDNGQSKWVTKGTRIRVTLESTYWKFSAPPQNAILHEYGEPVYRPVPLNETVPGSGEGTVEAVYEVTSDSEGSTNITASRTVCGEALKCSPEQSTYSVTIYANSPPK